MKWLLPAALLAVALAAAGCADYRNAVQAERALSRGYEAADAGRTAEAARWLRRAARLQPRSGPVQGRVGAALVQAGDARQALPYLERALTLPGPVPVTTLMAAVDAELAVGRTDRAARLLEQAGRLYRRNALLLNNVAYTYADRGVLLPQCVTLLRRASRLQPGEPQIEDSLGWALLRSGEVAAAGPYLRRAAAHIGPHAEVTYHLATLSLLEGDLAAARRLADRAVQLDRTYEPAVRLQRQLRQGSREGLP